MLQSDWQKRTMKNWYHFGNLPHASFVIAKETKTNKHGLIRVEVWQKTAKFCKAIILQYKIIKQTNHKIKKSFSSNLNDHQ